MSRLNHPLNMRLARKKPASDVNTPLATIGKHQKSSTRRLFPEKLWDLVNRPSSGIQWSPDGKRIEVERTQLEKFIGTKFRSHNFDSFIRQLHFYGFRKCGNSYHHDKFQRGQPEALFTMRRKYSHLKISSICLPNRSQSPCYTSNTSSDDSLLTIATEHKLTPATASISHPSDPSDGAIDLSSGVAYTDYVAPQANDSARQSAIVDLSSTCQAIDYSGAARRSVATSTRSPVKTLKNASKDLKQRKVSSEDTTIYSIVTDAKSGPSKYVTSVESLMSNSSVQESQASIVKNSNSIQISVPESSDDTSKIAWPKTLVLESCLNGSQNILSAYFIYRTDESH